MFRIQDKGSRLVVELKERYKRKMLDYLEDVSIFQENDENQCQANEKKSMTGLENGKIRNSWEVKKLSGFCHQKQDQPRNMPILRLIKKERNVWMVSNNCC